MLRHDDPEVVIQKLRDRNKQLEHRCASFQTSAREYQKKLLQICEKLGVRPWSTGRKVCVNCRAECTVEYPCVCNGARRLIDDPLGKSIAAAALAACGVAVGTVAQQKGE